MVLFALADGTGGFVIVNTNDLFGGLQKIGKEEDQFYLLGYTPAESEEGSCHLLKVKLDRPGIALGAVPQRLLQRETGGRARRQSG